MAKYALSALEFRRAATRGGENAPPWENKSMWVFYVDLVTGTHVNSVHWLSGLYITYITTQTFAS